MPDIINIKRPNLLRGRINHESQPRLPWIINEPLFLNNCSQCNNCITSCDNQIIKQDRNGFPFVDFDENECTFCMKCIDICQQPLFKSTETQQTDKPWQGDFIISSQCLAQNDIFCQSCRDVCETKAISFSTSSQNTINDPTIIYQGSPIAKPYLHNHSCTQCGACVSVCPQDAIALQKESNQPPLGGSCD
jgi:ferredoxin-type protein NapF